MCNVSAVFDQWKPYFPPSTIPWPPIPVTIPPSSPNPAFSAAPSPPAFTPAELREFIDAFNRAVEAAKVFDRLTGQPDCEDPEKAKLLDRVEELERRLDELETHD